MQISQEIIERIKSGGVVVMPTDTIYGLVCRADNAAAVNRLLSLKHRDNRYPPVIIIGSPTDLAKLGIKLTARQKNIIKKLWPGPYSLILPCSGKKFNYLHGGLSSIAVRLPRAKWLTDFIKETGPLATSSANIHKQDSATTIEEAVGYFGNKVDMYVVSGRIKNNPSTIISLVDDNPVLVRQGAGKTPKTLQTL